MRTLPAIAAVLTLLLLVFLTGLAIGSSLLGEKTTDVQTITEEQTQTHTLVTTAVVVQLVPAVVAVSGKVSTNDAATSATRIVFSNQKALFSANVTNGVYSARLLSGLYNITIYTVGRFPFQDYGYFQFDPAMIGTILVNASSTSSLEENWNVSTPNSEVNVSGSVITNDHAKIPSEISFYLGATGDYYMAKVREGHYSIILPNLEYYSVSIKFGLPQTGSCTPSPNQLAVIVFEGVQPWISSDWVC